MTLRVTVFSRGRRALYLKYRDPHTNKWVSRSAQTHDRREAERAAARWEQELAETNWSPGQRVRWEVARHQYEQLALKAVAHHTRRKYVGVLNSFEESIKPSYLDEVSTAVLRTYQSHLRAAGRAASTIDGHMTHLKAFLRWSTEHGMLKEAPAIPKVPRARRVSKVMRGRPLTVREFGRMLKAARRLHPDSHPRWRFYLKGLWWSGLRLEESLHLYWDRGDKLRPELDREYPLLWIPAELEKGNRDRLLPMAPEFAEHLKTVPEADRSGPVFVLPKQKQRRGRNHASPDWVSRKVSAIGTAAGIVVNDSANKHASAHDLRRSFGVRWSERVMPQILMELMRHENIDTTMKYYVGRDAERTAKVLHGAFSGATQ